MTDIKVKDHFLNTYINSEVFDKLSNLGCCKTCSIRYCGETRITSFRTLYGAIEDNIHCRQACTETENALKKVASNPCVACLGMLQPPMSEKVIDKIVEAVSKEGYDNPTFNVALTLPVSFYLRAHAMLVFLVNNYPEYVKENLPLGHVTVGVKDAWKYIFADKIADRVNKTYDSESTLKIEIVLQYQNDHSETECLYDMYPDKFNRYRKTKRLTMPVAISRKNVETVLELANREHFMKFHPVPPPVPSHAAFCSNVALEQSCIYIGGKYNKYIRELPQTAWLVHDQRKLKTSVHELIGEWAQALTGAKGSKLVSSGREDVDVRMLGSGRPFALELINPRKIVLGDKDVEELEKKINTEGAGRVSVSHLKVLPKSSLEILKNGEEHKTKTYVAYCVAWDVDLSKLTAVAKKAPLTLEQKTPIRVLHRRPIATRSKTVHWLTVSDMKASPAEDTTYFKLTLNTQAGTYIKEFIHGDFGRTRPSLGDLLGGVTADCLALDVQSIELDWPP